MTELTGWMEGQHTGLEAFRQAVRDAVHRAADEGWPAMWWVDPDFRDWPLGEQVICQDLHRWAQGGGSLRMLASSFRRVQADQPRFVDWRRQWDHRFEARSSGRQRAAETPCHLVGPQATLWRADPVHGGFVISSDAGLRARWREGLESLWQQSVPGFAATTLGL